MPELPEVETITNDLRTELIGSKIIKAKVYPNYINISQQELEKVENKEIVNILRVSKNILLQLTEKTYLRIHLAMSGRILIRKNKDHQERWHRFQLELTKDGEKIYFNYTDMRKFGRINVFTPTQVQELIQRHGPEIIAPNLTNQEFHQILKSKKVAIKNLLLDQKKVAGLGNIYATEALFLAGIHPEQNSHTLSNKKASKLLESAREVLQEGIKTRGVTMADKMYVDIYENEGKYQNNFKIYAKEKCDSCGAKVDFIKVGGRGTYYCPTCQGLKN